MTSEVLALGLVCWLTTLILVESELVRPVRDWVDRCHERTGARALVGGLWVSDDGDPTVAALASLRRGPRRTHVLWGKLRYLIGCHLCTGTWVGLVLAWMTSTRLVLTGAAGIVLAGLLVKAVGHVVLEVTALMRVLTKRLGAGATL